MERSDLIINKKEVVVSGGCVVAEHPLAAEVGAKMLAEGGNAVDAAVATAFAVGVVEPMMSGVGGGGALLLHLAKEGRNVGIDFLPRAPQAARADMFELDPQRKAAGIFSFPAVKDDANIYGHKSVGVPGAVAGLCMALEKYGTRSLASVLEPAIGLAEEGYVVDWYVGGLLASNFKLLRRFPATAEVFLPDGAPPATPIRTYLEAEPLRQPDLARTLRRLAAAGPEEFYHGDTGRAIVDEMARNGGLLRAEDLASYRATHFDEPLLGSYKDFTLVATPGSTAGPTIVEMFNILEGFQLADLGFQSGPALHVLAESQRLAYLDRFKYLSDPDIADIPIEGLVSKAYAEERRRTIGMDRAGENVAAGDPWAHQKGKGPQLDTPARVPTDSGCTTHLCVVDKDRNMVSLTNTLGSLWGSAVTVPGTGVLLNDGMVWYDPVPGHINSVSPGRRPLSNLTAILLLRDGKPFMTIGSPGGRKVTTAVLQAVLNVVDYGKNLQDGIAAPRIHCESQEIQVDSRIPTTVLNELEAMGHPVQSFTESYIFANFARPVGIMVDLETGQLRSGVDVFRPATAVGF